jgi:hypothetical protein
MIRIDRPPREAEGMVLTAMEEAGIPPEEFVRDSYGRVHVVQDRTGSQGSSRSPRGILEGQVVVDVAPVSGEDASCVSIVGKPARSRNLPPRREPQFVETIRENLREAAGEDFHALHNDPESETFELVGEASDGESEAGAPDESDGDSPRFDDRTLERRADDVVVEVSDDEATGQFLVRPPETGVTHVAPADSPTRHQDDEWVAAAREYLRQRAHEGEIEFGEGTTPE